MMLEFLVCDLADDGQYQDHAKTHTRLWRVRQGCRRFRPKMALHGQISFSRSLGIYRMKWLAFDKQSPQRLDISSYTMPTMGPQRSPFEKIKPKGSSPPNSSTPTTLILTLRSQYVQRKVGQPVDLEVADLYVAARHAGRGHHLVVLLNFVDFSALRGHSSGG